MFSMKKVGTYLLILVLITSMFAGCTPKATETKTEPTQTTEATQEAQQPAEPVKITFWHNYDEGAGQVAVLDELIKQFEAENQGITVEPQYLEWQALKDNVIAGATTGQLPDVMRGDIGFVPQFQSLNVLLEMDTAFPDYSETATTVMEAPNSTAKASDHFYGIAANTNTKILYYNKKMVTNEPKSLDEMWQAALDASKDGVTGFVEAWLGGWNLGQYIWSNGGDILAPDYSTAEGYINGPAAVEVLTKMAELHKAGAFNGPSIDPGAPGDTEGLGTGKYAMTVDGPWKANDLASKYPDMEFGAVQLPPGKAGSIGVLGGEDFMMFKSSDKAHQDAAWKFVKFMVGKDAQIAMAKVGQMPVNKEALKDAEVIKAMPLLPVFAKALETAKSRPVTPKWSDMEGIINTKATEAVLGQKTPQQALDEAAKEIDALINQ